MSPIAPTLQLFFTERLAKQRQASPATIRSYRRYLRTTPTGLLRLDAAAVAALAAAAKLDGKYLLRTSDPQVSLT